MDKTHCQKLQAFRRTVPERAEEDQAGVSTCLLNVTGWQETGDGGKVCWDQQQEFHMDSQPPMTETRRWAALEVGLWSLFKTGRHQKQEKTLSVCVDTWEGFVASHVTRCYEVSFGKSGLPRAVRAGVASKTSCFFRDQRAHPNSHNWGSNQGRREGVKSDALEKKKWSHSCLTLCNSLQLHAL